MSLREYMGCYAHIRCPCRLNLDSTFFRWRGSFLYGDIETDWVIPTAIQRVIRLWWKTEELELFFLCHDATDSGSATDNVVMWLHQEKIDDMPILVSLQPILTNTHLFPHLLVYHVTNRVFYASMKYGLVGRGNDALAHLLGKIWTDLSSCWRVGKRCQSSGKKTSFLLAFLYCSDQSLCWPQKFLQNLAADIIGIFLGQIFWIDGRRPSSLVSQASLW